MASSCTRRPTCLFDEDCEEGEICLNGRCAYSPSCQDEGECDEGYECVDGQCFETICRGPQDCEADQICDAGACTNPPITVVECVVATQDQTVSPGQTVRLEAFALDPQGNSIAANFVWMSDDTSVVSVSGALATAEQKAGSASLRAALGDGDPVMCRGEVTLTNLGPPPSPGNLRVVVLDAETSSPVVGAEVVIAQATPSQATTDASGIARFVIGADIPYDVSVFDDDHDYLTVNQVRSRDIRLPLNPRSGTGPVAGFKGSFDTSSLTSRGDFNLGLAGASIPGGLINFDLTRLLGESFVTDFSIPTQGDISFPIPGGLTLYGDFIGLPIEIKRTYYANTPGGVRLGWGLAGRVPIAELIGLFQGGGFEDIGDIITLLLPLFNRFDHALKPMTLTEAPRIQDLADIDGDGDTTELVPDYPSFPTHDLRPSVRQQLVTAVDVSNLPLLSDGPAEAAILVGGAVLDSTGFVPLGISATADDDGDGRPDIRRLTLAPPHGAIAGSRFALLSIAFRTDSLGGPNGTSFEFPDEFSAALWNGQSLPSTVKLGTFPSTAITSLDSRQRAIDIQADAGPLFRVRMVGQRRSWDVWSVGQTGGMGQFSGRIIVPGVPSGVMDLYMTNDKIFVDSIRTQVKLDDLLKPSGIRLYDVALVATGFARTLVESRTRPPMP